MLEDATSDPFVLDHGDESHRPCTPRASQNIDRVRSLHQHSAVDPSLAAGVVGLHADTDDLISIYYFANRSMRPKRACLRSAEIGFAPSQMFQTS